MSRASELADWCDEHSSGDYRTSAEAATELRRLERVNAELVEALECAERYLTGDAPRSVSTDKRAAFDIRAALTSATKETKE